MDDSEIFSITNDAPLEDDDISTLVPREVIKVIGVGGAGGNALNTIIRSGIDDVDFIAGNTDVAALRLSEASAKLILGRNLTKGRGAGANPSVGQEAAQESEEEITNLLEGADMVFITAGMGGGTGTGAAPVIAGIAKDKVGALVVAIVTYPFSWEGPKRIRQATEGISRLREKVDALVIVHNDRIIELSDKSTTWQEAFKMSDEVLRQAVAGVTGVIRKIMQVNVDFADVCTIMRDAGTAIMGVGEAKGDGRVLAAARAAMNGPLMTAPMNGASSVLYCIESGEDLSILEMNEAAKLISASAREDANIIWGQGIDPSMGDTVRFTLIATGFKDVLVDKNDAKAQAGSDSAGLFEKQNLTPSDVVSEEPRSIFEGLGSGLDIPTTYRRRKK
ncbi:MAG: cell division protein FtsZ [Pyramidobacter sp.]|uniref:cell division protein FtsZ n=1 Tax=Pyramidobacter sp. TaxID=1943581 RepID=UPI002A7FD5FE|nr:cell division protein FtsZ [Pyramidobacter sp.]MDY4031656.1 cell division protein FtsZ [Pyramidobacter sp.]